MTWLAAATARPRLLAAVAAGLAVGLLAPGDLRPATRLLYGWDVTATLWLGLVAVMMARADIAEMQSRADEDVGAAAILALAVAAAIASLAAIGIELSTIKSAPDGDKSVAIVTAAFTILLSWLLTHTMFAIHYAHEFYKGDDDRRGLAVPNENEPDYWDFLYFSLTIGAASQTSDIAVTSRRMRRFALAHTVLAFLFNTTVLALAINVGAGLI